MLTIAICDDEAKILPSLKQNIETKLQMVGIEARYYLFQTCEELYEKYDQLQIDVLFLDIDMPGMSGFDLAKMISEKPRKCILVFVTNQDALVYESFTFHPFAFIRKAYFKQEITEVLRRMISEYEKKPEYFTFHIGNETIRLAIQTMIYFEAEGNYVWLVTTEEKYRIRETLSNLEKRLASSGFIRVHKGFLVNQSFIVAVKQNDVELTNQIRIPVSRTNRESVRKKLMEYLR